MMRRGTRYLSEVPNPKIAMAELAFDAGTSAMCIRMYPSDTLSQSRALYGDPSAVDEILVLQSDGWLVQPNFHWGFMASGYAWPTTRIPVEKYTAHWIKTIGATRELPRWEWKKYWAQLESAAIVKSTEKDAFDKDTRAQRKEAQPRPGI